MSFKSANLARRRICEMIDNVLIYLTLYLHLKDCSGLGRDPAPMAALNGRKARLKRRRSFAECFHGVAKFVRISPRETLSQRLIGQNSPT
jgi:hypothetical protein